METSFLFLDDSFNEETKISSLTGILVPLDRFRDARTRFYQIIRFVLWPNGIPVNPIFLEIHGRNLLQGFKNAEDDLKLRVARHVVELVLQNELKVLRVGHYVTKENIKLFRFDRDYRKYCFHTFVSRLQDTLKDEAVILIMDGFDRSTVRSFSKHIRSLDLMREFGFGNIKEIQNTANILGEVFYADSRFSIFTQVVDIISYLRQCSDFVREGKRITNFKKQLADISDRLAPVIFHEEIAPFPPVQ